MPLRFQSIIEEECRRDNALAWVLELMTKTADGTYATSDKQYFMIYINVINTLSNKIIGKLVFTIYNNKQKKQNEVKDIDFVLNSDNRIPMQFDKISNNSEYDEYFEVFIPDTDYHFSVELVNQHVLDEPLVVDGIYHAYLSAMPYKLTIFDSYESYNKMFGFPSEGIKVAGMDDYVVHGVDEKFTAPAAVFKGNSESGSLIAGIIKSYEDVELQFGQETVSAYLVILNSAMGDLPTIVGKDVFDTKNIGEGKIMGMFADIKADFAGNYYFRPTTI